MVISDKFEFVYIDVPKTGSISFERIFKEKFFAKAVSPKNSNLTKHCREIPPHAQNYKKIISVRNPYDRLKSLYSFHLQRQTKIDHEYTVDDFLNKIINEVEEYQKNGFLMYLSINDYLLPFDLHDTDYIIHLENAEEQINNLEFVDTPVVFPWRNKSEKKSVNMLNFETIKKVNIWAQHDFKQFGYEKIT